MDKKSVVMVGVAIIQKKTTSSPAISHSKKKSTLQRWPGLNLQLYAWLHAQGYYFL